MAGLSEDFLRVAGFAVDGFGAVESVGGEKLHGLTVGSRVVFRAVRAVANAFEEFAGIPKCHAVEVALIGVSPWDWEVMLAVELEFLRDDSERFLGGFALDGPVQYVIRYFRNVFREFGSRDGLFDFRERRLVVGPMEDSLRAFSENLLPGERVVFLCHRLVVSEGRDRTREKFSPLARLFHMFDNARNESFVFFLGILLVENAVFLVAETNAAEEVGR